MTEAPARRPKGRSPSYPAINLESAIQRAEEVWAKERQHALPVETLPQHWGYKSLNGPASSTLAALKKFGLVSDEGSGDARRTRVTDLAVDILANPSFGARADAVKRAALMPSIHKELWEKYGPQLPSDASLRWELTRERGFTETGANEFVREYRDTLQFARLSGADEAADGAAPDTEATSNALSEVDSDDAHIESRTPAYPDRAPEVHKPIPQVGIAAYKIPLTDGTTVEVSGHFPLTEDDWNQFLAVLQAMKPGLVRRRDTLDD